MRLSKQFVLLTVVAIISGAFFGKANSQQLPDFSTWFESADEKLPDNKQEDLISSLLAQIQELRDKLEYHDGRLDEQDGRFDKHDQRLQTAESNISILQSSGATRDRSSDS